MAAPGDINLIRTKTRLSPEMLIFAERLRVISWAGLIGTIIIGILTGLLYLEFQRERQGVAEQKQQLLASIAANARKESLFIALKDRIPLVSRALNSEKPWGNILDTVALVAAPPTLYSVTVDDHQVVQLNLKSNSFDEVAGWVARVINLVNQQKVRSPQLVSFQFAKEGTILVSLSFIPQ